MRISACRFAGSALGVLLLVAVVVANAQNCNTSNTACGRTIKSKGDHTVDSDLDAARGFRRFPKRRIRPKDESGADPGCSSPITACGCTINSAGNYTVDSDLNATQGLTSSGGCIDVAASSVELFTNGHNITGAGTGTGVGIHLLSGATNLFLSAAGPGSSYTTISGWQYGIESETSNVTEEAFYFSGNSTGVLLSGATNNNFSLVAASSNSVYGVWIEGGSANQIDYGAAWDNTVAGVYIGCSGTGPTGPACSDSDGPTSSGNFVFEILSYSLGTQSYGLVVENGGTQNTLVDNQFFGDTVDDLFDGNAGGANVWNANLFSTANQGYIQ